MKVGVLTSSRADYGIYRPLLRMLDEDPFFELHLLVFGTHLSKRHGYSVSEIDEEGFSTSCRIETTPDDDSPGAIARSMGKTIIEFSKIWESASFDLIIALGDRYEMFAAVSSSVPFNIAVAHIHGGETTLGAFDNSFRHSITHFSSLHFASCEQYRSRIVQLTGYGENVYNAGALSMDNLKSTVTLTMEEFRDKYGVDISMPFILMTFHPETLSGEENISYVSELTEAIAALKGYQVLITMPNADPLGLYIRESFQKLADRLSYVHCVDNLGTRGYFSCLKECRMMLGNSSSGFTEALYFDKPVVNTGDRQKGRIMTSNIINCEIKKDAVLAAVHKAESYVPGSAVNIFGDGNSALFITQKIKEFFNKKKI